MSRVSIAAKACLLALCPRCTAFSDTGRTEYLRRSRRLREGGTNSVSGRYARLLGTTIRYGHARFVRGWQCLSLIELCKDCVEVAVLQILYDMNFCCIRFTARKTYMRHTCVRYVPPADRSNADSVSSGQKLHWSCLASTSSCPIRCQQAVPEFQSMRSSVA